MHIGGAAIFLLLSGVIAASAEQAMAPDRDAGTWKTWVISSGKDFRVPPPPDRGATEKEAVEVAKRARPPLLSLAVGCRDPRTGAAKVASCHSCKRGCQEIADRLDQRRASFETAAWRPPQDERLS